jgi:hypothetical protein
MVDRAPAHPPQPAQLLEHRQQRPHVLQREHERVQRVAAAVMLRVLGSMIAPNRDWSVG